MQAAKGSRRITSVGERIEQGKTGCPGSRHTSEKQAFHRCEGLKHIRNGRTDLHGWRFQIVPGLRQLWQCVGLAAAHRLRCKALARRKTKARKNRTCLDRLPRIDQDSRIAQSMQPISEIMADPLHQPRGRGIKADGNIGAQSPCGIKKARIIEPAIIEAREQAQGRRRIAGATTDAGGDRQRLHQLELPG